MAIAYIAGSLKLNMARPSFPQRRILVVDDETFVCESVRLLLTFDGHTVEVATDPKQALELYDHGTFDIVFTDFEMPTMKGDELAAAIKARNPRQPVVMITAYAELLRDQGNPLKGVDCVIAKPFLLENLREAIAKVAPAQPKTGEIP